MKKNWHGWLIRFLILAALLGVVGAFHWQVSQWREAVNAKQEQLRQAPVQELAAASLRSDLRRKQEDVSQVLELVPTREGVVGVVTAIEEEGKRRGLEAAVVDIKEAVGVSPEGEGGSSLQNVELQVVASGDPAELMEFLYAVELLPYLLYGNSWRLTVGGTQVAARGTGAAAPAEVGAPVDLPEVNGKLVLDIVLAVRNDSIAL